MGLLPVISCLFDSTESRCTTESVCATAAAVDIIRTTSSTGAAAAADHIGHAAVSDEDGAEMWDSRRKASADGDDGEKEPEQKTNCKRMPLCRRLE